MQAIKHPMCNDVLRAPEGQTDCEDLPIRREAGHVWSFWKPGDEELAMLVRGGSIVLIAQGETHPPIALGATVPDTLARHVEDAAEVRAVYEANKARCGALLRIAKRAIAELVALTGNQHESLVNEFVDLIALNQCAGEVVRELPNNADNVRTNETAPE